jgi:hypothetical protein
VCFESLQLISPETFNLADPVAKLRERLSPELQQPGSRIILDHLLLDETRRPQDSQVAAHRRTAHIQHIRYFAGAQGTLAQQFDDGAARGVCQSRQSLVKISSHGRPSHLEHDA